MQRLRDQHAGGNEEQRVAVGWRGGEFAQRWNEVAAGSVLDEHSGAQVFAHLLRDEARHHVGRTAGGEPDEETDRFGGKILRRGRRRRGAQQDYAGEET
jgi:hypothetical protein